MQWAKNAMVVRSLLVIAAALLGAYSGDEIDWAAVQREGAMLLAMWGLTPNIGGQKKDGAL